MQPGQHLKFILKAVVAILILSVVIVGGVVLYDWYQQQNYIRLAQRSNIHPVKVFQIGFSKCATSSIAELFNKSGVLAVHHDFGNLALSMHENAQANLPLIPKHYEQYNLFADMENMYNEPLINIGVAYFKLLDLQYPGSKFILNTRNKQAWLKSRSKHNFNGTPLLQAISKTLKIQETEVLAMWSQEWDSHHKAVLEYFKDRPNDLLIFNIESDPIEKLIIFFKDNYKLNSKYYTHKNKTHSYVAADDERVQAVELFSKTYALQRHRST